MTRLCFLYSTKQFLLRHLLSSILSTCPIHLRRSLLRMSAMVSVIPKCPLCYPVLLLLHLGHSHYRSNTISLNFLTLSPSLSLLHTIKWVITFTENLSFYFSHLFWNTEDTHNKHTPHTPHTQKKTCTHTHTHKETKNQHVLL